MSSDSPSLHRIIHDAWKNIAHLRSQYEGNLPVSSPTSVTRIRSLTFASPPNHDSYLLPRYVNAIEFEKLDYLHKTSPFTFNLQTKIVSLIFQAVLSYQAMSTTKDQPFILGPAMVIAFAASFSVMFIKHTHPRLSTIVEKIGYLCFALCFFIMTRVFFSGNLITWMIIGGLAWAILAFLFISQI